MCYFIPSKKNNLNIALDKKPQGKELTKTYRFFDEYFSIEHCIGELRV